MISASLQCCDGIDGWNCQPESMLLAHTCAGLHPSNIVNPDSKGRCKLPSERAPNSAFIRSAISEGVAPPSQSLVPKWMVIKSGLACGWGVASSRGRGLINDSNSFLRL